MTESYDREIKTPVVKFNAVGDYIKGTLTGVTVMSKPDKWGKINTVYTVKAKDGQFLGTTKNEKTGKWVEDKEPTLVHEGEEWVFFANGVTVGLMKKIKLGQKFMIKFTETKPSTKGQDAKIKKVFPALDNHGKILMDEEWIKSNKEGNVQYDESLNDEMAGAIEDFEKR